VNATAHRVQVCRHVETGLYRVRQPTASRVTLNGLAESILRDPDLNVVVDHVSGIRFDERLQFVSVGHRCPLRTSYGSLQVTPSGKHSSPADHSVTPTTSKQQYLPSLAPPLDSTVHYFFIQCTTVLYPLSYRHVTKNDKWTLIYCSVYCAVVGMCNQQRLFSPSVHPKIGDIQDLPWPSF
jgi:hypothetical protein